MNTFLLDTLHRADNIPSFREINKGQLDFLLELKELKEFVVRIYNGTHPEPWTYFSKNNLNETEIKQLCDFSQKELPERCSDFFSKPDIQGKVFISPYIQENSHLGDFIAVIDSVDESEDMQWQIFTDIMARKVCSKYCFPEHISDFQLYEPQKMLLFIKESQAILNTNQRTDSLPPGNEKKQAEIWHKEDSKIIGRFLSRLLQKFNLQGAFVVQQAAPGFLNKFSMSPKEQATEIEELIETVTESAYVQNQMTHWERECSKVPFNNLSPLVFSCQAGGITFGHFGFISSESYIRRHINHRSKLMPMLANQLGLYFSHLYQLRKEALHGRMLQQINQTCNTINSSVDIGAIIFKLIESLNYLFGQFSGAILVFSRETGDLEIANYLGGRLPEDFDLEKLISKSGPVLDAINEGAAFDNRTKRHLIPVRYVLPLASTPQASVIDGEFIPLRALGGVLLCDSVDNRILSEEELNKLMPILLNGISASLQVACNYAEKLDTIKALEGLMNGLSNTDDLLDQMVTIIRRLLKVNRISFLTMSKDKKHLYIKKSYGLPEGIKEKTLIPLGEEISGYVALKAKSYRIDDIESKGIFQKRSQEDYLNRSLLSVPLIRGKNTKKAEVIGVINVNNKTNGLTFTRQDQELLEAIANLVVTAMDNMRLLQESHEQMMLERQLSDAREIQMSLLPKSFSNLPPSIEAYGQSIPAKHIGGDFFDIIRMRDGRLLGVLGDVSGKGMPAAILMAMTRMIIRSVVSNCSDLVQIMQRVNHSLCNELDSYHFVTLQLVALNPDNGEAVMTSAGHGPLMARIDNKIELIETKGGPPLGITGINAGFDQMGFRLSPGDGILMYTDGLSEERGSDREMFGNERIAQMVLEGMDRPQNEFAKTLIDAAVEWRGDKEAHDDLTILSLKFKGNNNAG